MKRSVYLVDEVKWFTRTRKHRYGVFRKCELWSQDYHATFYWLDN